MFKTKHSTLFLHRITFLTLLSVTALTSNYFNTTTDAKIWLSYTPYSVAIATYSEEEVAVSLADGSINVYSLANHSLLYTLSGCHNRMEVVYSIKEIRNNGWVSIDQSGTACRWNSKRQLIMKWSFPNTNRPDISVTFMTNGSSLIAFNFRDRVHQYDSETTSSVPKLIYKPLEGFQFRQIQYNGYGSKLFILAQKLYNTYELQIFNCSNGLYLGTVLSNISRAGHLNKAGNGNILFYASPYVYSIDSELNIKKTFFPADPQIVVVSPRNFADLYIAMYDLRVSRSLRVFDQSGVMLQQLRYTDYLYLSVDASRKYLAYIVFQGYLGIATYSDMESPVEKEMQVSTSPVSHNLRSA